jgi:hypothetical protein
VEKPVRRVVEGATERAARALDQDLDERRGHRGRTVRGERDGRSRLTGHQRRIRPAPGAERDPAGGETLPAARPSPRQPAGRPTARARAADVARSVPGRYTLSPVADRTGAAQERNG